MSPNTPQAENSYRNAVMRTACGFWRLSNCRGAVCGDEMGQSHGTWTLNPSPANWSNGINFDKEPGAKLSTGIWASVAHTTSLVWTNDVTLEFSMRAPTTSQATGGLLEKKTTVGFSLSRTNLTNALRVVSITSGGTTTTDTGVVLWDNQPHLVQVRWSSGLLHILKDGKLAYAGTYTHGSGLSNTAALAISGTSADWFTGELKDVSLHKTLLPMNTLLERARIWLGDFN